MFQHFMTLLLRCMYAVNSGRKKADQGWLRTEKVTKLRICNRNNQPFKWIILKTPLENTKIPLKIHQCPNGFPHLKLQKKT